MIPVMFKATRAPDAIAPGHVEAAADLLPLVYEELRKLAAQRLAHESPGQTLQATALVHEAYARLVDAGGARDWNGRGHFFAAAAEAMRRILVESARRKRSLKRGGDRGRQGLDEASSSSGPAARAGSATAAGDSGSTSTGSIPATSNSTWPKMLSRPRNCWPWTRRFRAWSERNLTRRPS